MGQIHRFEPEKMIVGVIFSEEEKLKAALAMLEEHFGPVDHVSETFCFSDDFSTYYDKELGGKGMRRIYSFRDPVDASRQAGIKTLTNEIEQSLSVGGARHVNLDPGFINRGRLMLATTKDASFRIPLGDGIYTELTLFFARGAWQKLPWTYRDYQSERVQKFLTEVREIYLEQRKRC